MKMVKVYALIEKIISLIKQFFKQSYPQFNLIKNSFTGIMYIEMECDSLFGRSIRVVYSVA
jgi:hypothetical protein